MCCYPIGADYALMGFFSEITEVFRQPLKPSPTAARAFVVQSLSETCQSNLTSTAKDVVWENMNPVEALFGGGGLVKQVQR